MFIIFLVVRGMHTEFLDVSSVNSKCLIMTREGCAAPLARAYLAELMVIGRSKDSSALVFYHHHVSSRPDYQPSAENQRRGYAALEMTKLTFRFILIELGILEAFE